MTPTETAQTRLVNTLLRRGNVLSIHHRKALYSLCDAFMSMSRGTLTGRWAFPIATGCGKTTAVVECCATLHQLGDIDSSVVVCASRIEALCKMQRDMIEAGIPAEKIGLIYAKAAKDKYSEPCTTDNEGRQFLLISHNRAARERHLGDINTYNGQPRSVVIYDESLLVSEIEHFLVDDLIGALGKWISKIALDLPTKPELASVSNFLTERRDTISFLYQNFDKDIVNLVGAPGYMLSIEEQVDWSARFKAAGDSILAEFLEVQHLELRLVRHNKTAAVSYKIAIPPALTNMIVLDASYPIRTLEQNDTTLHDAKDLPFCKKNQIHFDALKRFDNVTLYRMTQHGGRSSMATDKAKVKKIMLDTVKIIQGIPVEEEVLVFVYKARGAIDSIKTLTTELEHAGVDIGKRIHLQTWGNETSTNEFRQCRHVILVGVLHRDLTELEAHHLGQVNDIRGIVTPQTLKGLCLSERAHLAYQALSRGSCRVMGNDNEANQMTGYIIEAEEEIETALSSVMPGVVWKTWKPVYSDGVAHGYLLDTLKKRIGSALTTLAGDSVTCRSFKTAVLKGEHVAAQSWKIAMSEALSENPLWIQQDQRLQRAA